MISSKELKERTKCYHCGEACDEELLSDGKSFCCFGCKTVYEILQTNDLTNYYSLSPNPGSKQTGEPENIYSFLDEEEIRSKLLEFDSEDYAKVTFKAPSIHCSSCIWLLENLYKLDPGVSRSRVNFTRKEILIEFNPKVTSLGSIASHLKSIGYKPEISLQKNQPESYDKGLVLKLAVAGFCFGNIMLLSFPEYLGLNENETFFRNFFPWLNLALAIPVLLYSGSLYFHSAVSSIRQKQISIDVPIALGLSVIFFRSIWDISTATGPGYLDSLAGLIFFLLIGRWFQNQTYKSLAFDRDFKSYFPLAIRKLVEGFWKPTLIYHLKPGDKIQVRNNEIIPADSTLTSEKATINYSFVTGESEPIHATKGDTIYAGGQSKGLPIELEVARATSQSQLTDIWNQDAFRKSSGGYRLLVDRIARYFTWAVITIAAFTGIYWYLYDPSSVWLNVTAVLIVACPCALALATPFTYGTLMRVFGRHQFYLKNAEVGEHMSDINSFVFDKTGTLTHGSNPESDFNGNLSPEEMAMTTSLAGLSTHPLSNIISRSAPNNKINSWSYFKETTGKGIEGVTSNTRIKIGSAEFVAAPKQDGILHSIVYVSINDEYRGYFIIRASLRRDIKKVFSFFGNRVRAILSGDQDSEKARFRQFVSDETELHFRQTAADKMEYIRKLQHKGDKVMMFGDGLNDAGALKQSNIGIAVTDDTGLFTPACDGIIHGNSLGLFPDFIKLSVHARNILIAAFALSFIYNITALAFAVTGNLSPLLAAILMPASSISVVAFCAGSIELIGKMIIRK